MLSYCLLFLSAFLAATIFPFYSELFLAALLANGKNAALLWLVATVGNSLGAAVNWVLGRYCLRYQNRKWFPFRPKQWQRAQQWFKKYGVWSLLFAWLPVVGDVFTFVAGTMRIHFGFFLLLTTIGKGARYAVVILIAREIIQF